MSAASSFNSQIQSIQENEKKMGEFARKATDRLVIFYNEKQLGNQDGQFHSRNLKHLNSNSNSDDDPAGLDSRNNYIVHESQRR
jgi:hypothetical protein